MKIIAFYLPQFHTIAENDEWWGEGFTEWTNVKKAISLFKGHDKPEIPLNKYYYNLLDTSVQEKQAELASQYGVYGFCYYHYWFGGKLLLEKPMENMLHNPKIDFPFCVCWANESWTRNWDGKDHNKLIEQNYCESQEEWRKHFDYLLPFFLDKRYMRNNGKPILIIYKPQMIFNMEEMRTYWNELACKNGLEGICWIYQHPSAFESRDVRKHFDYGIEFEPVYTEREIIREDIGDKLSCKVRYILTHPLELIKKVRHLLKLSPNVWDYDKIWERILNRKPVEKNIIPGAFVAWDNTPRRGIEGTVFGPATPEKFGKYMRGRIQRAKEIYRSDYIFINAWNEWGEGAHLEPDEKHRYAYLEMLKKSLTEE